MRTVALVARLGCASARAAAEELAARASVPGFRFVLSDNADARAAEAAAQGGPAPDMVVAVGGDGTMLRAAALYGAAPLYVSVFRGTLGFLMHHSLDDGAAAVRSVLEAWAGGGSGLPPGLSCVLRRRLRVTLLDAAGRETALACALNEVSLHRGARPHVAHVACAVDGVPLLAHARADGVLLATATGSTAYALSAGGPLVHPGADAVVVVPVAPRSLAFRPVVLPASSRVLLSHDAPSKSGSHGVPPGDLPRSGGPLMESDALQCSVDGRVVADVPRGHGVAAIADARPLRVVCNADAAADWAGHVRRLLGWGRGFGVSED